MLIRNSLQSFNNAIMTCNQFGMPTVICDVLAHHARERFCIETDLYAVTIFGFAAIILAPNVTNIPSFAFARFPQRLDFTFTPFKVALKCALEHPICLSQSLFVIDVDPVN